MTHRSSFHQRKHFRVIQKSTLHRTGPMRADDHFFIDKNDRSNRELVELKASSPLPQRLGHAEPVPTGG